MFTAIIHLYFEVLSFSFVAFDVFIFSLLSTVIKKQKCANTPLTDLYPHITILPPSCLMCDFLFIIFLLSHPSQIEYNFMADFFFSLSRKFVLDQTALCPPVRTRTASLQSTVSTTSWINPLQSSHRKVCPTLHIPTLTEIQTSHEEPRLFVIWKFYPSLSIN